ncbi:DUF58 domain-containing protein [Pseudomaricurvus alkylphenolicus]|uniref:DUF58 domain-containing protein n=1 Tax=Pseudomaricurvus alkylphenolicus TaxID=1306991 RepID=UPI00141D777F|nr:DUF58 domain-containing protein [Pseudomaricurvus alkylphenolicus]NIB44563.1 DUF58 domain-containing protein [Pseudomaricurvus alkylphenolicus]
MSTTDFRQPPQGAHVELDDLLGLRFVAGELQLAPRSLSRSLLAGSVRTRFRGRGMEFEEVRHYYPGDDIRTIDWRVTARTQVPHTKLFREERERPVILMLDQRPSMFFGSRHCFKSVTAAHAAALLSWAALSQNDRIGALIFSDTEEKDIRPKRSRHTLLHVLQQTHQFNRQLNDPRAQPGSQPLSQRLLDLRRIAKPGAAIFVISDFHDLDEQCDEQLYRLARHADVNLLAVSDPMEYALPERLQLTVTDGQDRRLLDTGNRDWVSRYRDLHMQQDRHLQRLAAQLAIPLVQLSTQQAPLEALLPVFGKSACRR